jgi:hypothetical protein
VCDLIPDEGDAGGSGEIEGDIGAPCPNASAVVASHELLSMATLYSYSPAGIWKVRSHRPKLACLERNLHYCLGSGPSLARPKLKRAFQLCHQSIDDGQP